MGKHALSNCSLFHEKIICADGFLFRCCQGDPCYVPEDMIDIRELMECLEKELELLNTNGCQRLQSSPLAVPRKRRESEGEGSVESRSGSFMNKMSLYGNSPSKRRSSSNSSESNTPKSVLIKVTPKKADLGEEDDVCYALTNTSHSLSLDKFEEQFKWLCDKGSEYVAMETLRTLPEVFAYLKVITKTANPILLDLKLNQDKTMTLTYQFCKAFKQEFMMLKLGGDYCMFMAPF